MVTMATTVYTIFAFDKVCNDLGTATKVDMLRKNARVQHINVNTSSIY
jgi:hypothetical protein